ncbi:HTH-type transcriptional regulator LrpA [uncultured archaeon]|nr:HTH-type transcriptional regulator LrpA [uncultured archaeon]
MKIDLYDRKILYELDKNARVSFSKIAKKVRLSKNSVINRIKLLEKEKIILGYNTLINVNQIGYTTYDVYLKFVDTTPEKEQEIIDSVTKNKDVWMVSKVEGAINLAILISTKTPEEFYKIWDTIYRKINNFVKLVRISILLEYHHFTKEYLLDKDASARSTATIGKKEYTIVDEKDLKILKLLSENARVSLLDLSDKLDLTTKSIRDRIRKLEEKEIILGYKINLNFQKLGFEYYKILVSLNDLEIRDRLYNWIRTKPNVVYFDRFINGADFEFDVEINSFEKFVALLEDMKRDFRGVIQEVQWFKPTMIYKSNYFS